VVKIGETRVINDSSSGLEIKLEVIAGVEPLGSEVDLLLKVPAAEVERIRLLKKLRLDYDESQPIYLEDDYLFIANSGPFVEGLEANFNQIWEFFTAAGLALTFQTTSEIIEFCRANIGKSAS